jgi:phosphoribosylanthranilate isomerase
MGARIKICGLTRPDDAALAVSLGAWALGVIFAPDSPRLVELDRAAEVLAAHSGAVEKVGVFVNAPLEEIAAAVDACGLTVVQLHGDEDNDDCREVQEQTGCKVIKAIRVAGRESLDSVVRFDTDYLLLDTYHPGRHGGTGMAFDWNLAASLPEEVRFNRVILSGGLTPENIDEAVKLVTPFAIDVASGIESSAGIKDHERMKLLFNNLREEES